MSVLPTNIVFIGLHDRKKYEISKDVALHLLKGLV